MVMDEGCNPLAKATAKATAKRPQSVPLDCCVHGTRVGVEVWRWEGGRT